MPCWAPIPEANQNYDYLLAQSEVYRQRHQSWNAMMALSQADQLGGGEIAELEGMQVAGEEGLRVTDHLSVLTNFTTGGLYDDSTIYMLDKQIFGITNNANLPPPRSQQESLWTTAYRYHFDNGFPMLSGFFQIRNANGEESLPQEALIINRNTYDYNFNSALNPVVHIGNASLAFNTGMQFTIRRDTEAPQYMNQNLFREFLYVSSSSFGNWLSFNGAHLSRSRSVHRDQLPAEFQRHRKLAEFYRWDVRGPGRHLLPDTPGAT